MFAQLLPLIEKGDQKAIARSISLVENEVKGYQNFLRSLHVNRNTHLIGITGPPGAGKSTLTDALIGLLVQEGKKIGVICVDPSSPFHLGALLGDRIRMSRWYNHPQVYIRSLATRGSLGGLHPRIIEITDILRAAQFDQIIVETVGVGQSEIEIAGLADTTVVVLVPEAGDEIQTMKAGVMEIADVFVVNKADRPGADTFATNLRQMLHTSGEEQPLIIKTIGSKNAGIAELAAAIANHHHLQQPNEKKLALLTEKAWHLLRNRRMQDISKNELKDKIEKASKDQSFNLYEFIEQF